MFLTAIHATVRALGLGMRVALSRLLGAEIMGIAELCSGVHMLAITPLTSGLPLAISRATARADAEHKRYPLLAGLDMVRIASAVLIPLLLLSSPLLAWLMRDERVLPSLWMTAPCILVLGYSACFNGYCYGTERSWLPAVSELTEQVVRCGLTLALVTLCSRLTAPWLAAIPVFSTLIAEGIGLWLVLALLRVSSRAVPAARAYRRPVFRLAAPTTLTRGIHTALRSFTALLIPRRLQLSGLTTAESTARLGMLNGMALPLVLLPCIFTNALSMVLLPKLAKAEQDPPALRRLLRLSLCAGLAVGLLGAWLLALSAPFLASVVFRQPDLAALLRYACLLAPLTALTQLSGGALAGLGMQKRALYGALAASALQLALTFALTPLPALRLRGALWGLYASHATELIWNVCLLFERVKPIRPGSRFGPRRRRAARPSPDRPPDRRSAAAATAAPASPP